MPGRMVPNPPWLWLRRSLSHGVPSGTVTGVIVPSDILGPAAQGINPGEPTAFDELVRAIRAGYTYVNVHTTRWTGGEIRGQIKVAVRDRD